ncbi:hypothetical protein L3i22_036150 [Actinoplanes sp. L3-i22]|nr:hypothetical protein L3i22_036150 [Actinoplanes sp. L3-i22]
MWQRANSERDGRESAEEYFRRLRRPSAETTPCRQAQHRLKKTFPPSAGTPARLGASVGLVVQQA